MKILIYFKTESQRVPNKNFRLFEGRPLYQWVLERLSKYQVYVNTDNSEANAFLKESPNFKHVHSYLRSENHKSCEDMIEHFLNTHIEDIDEPVFVRNVTAPFVSEETMEKAYKAILSKEYDSAVSVIKLQKFCFREVELKDGKKQLVPLSFDVRWIPPTQSLEPLFVFSDGFYAFTKRSYFQHHNRIGKKVFLVESQYPETIDIDNEEDWIQAQATLNWTRSQRFPIGIS